MRYSGRVWKGVTTVSALVCGTFFLLHARGSLSAQNEFFPIWDCKIAHGSSCHEVAFYVFTRYNVDTPEYVTAGNLSSSYFDPSKPTTLLIHGYSAGMNLSQLISVKNAYLQNRDQNVIMVHYLSLVDTPCYLFAVVNIRYVADCMETFVRTAVQQGLLKTIPNEYAAAPPRVLLLHVVGFSLGAHTAGMLGKRLKRDYIVERITGLDPAMPLFMGVSESRKLMKSDAQLVDVFHTNSFFQGKPSHIGHIDFYFNGGITQPGCETNVLRILECDHHRALEFFAESINSTKGFWGWPCESDLHMFEDRCPPAGQGALAGQDWTGQIGGVFLVDTNAAKPFAKGRWWLAGNSPVRRSPRASQDEDPSVSRVIRKIALKKLNNQR